MHRVNQKVSNKANHADAKSAARFCHRCLRRYVLKTTKFAI